MSHEVGEARDAAPVGKCQVPCDSTRDGTDPSASSFTGRDADLDACDLPPSVDHGAVERSSHPGDSDGAVSAICRDADRARVWGRERTDHPGDDWLGPSRLTLRIIPIGSGDTESVTGTPTVLRAPLSLECACRESERPASVRRSYRHPYWSLLLGGGVGDLDMVADDRRPPIRTRCDPGEREAPVATAIDGHLQ